MKRGRGPRRRTAATQDSACRRSCGETEHEPGADGHHALSHDEPDDAADRCAERSTNADLGCTLGDEVAEHAVQADRRQHERQRTEQAEQRRAETKRQHVAADALGQRLHRHERQVAREGSAARRAPPPRPSQGCASSRSARECRRERHSGTAPTPGIPSAAARRRGKSDAGSRRRRRCACSRHA